MIVEKSNTTGGVNCLYESMIRILTFLIFSEVGVFAGMIPTGWCLLKDGFMGSLLVIGPLKFIKDLLLVEKIGCHPLEGLFL